MGFLRNKSLSVKLTALITAVTTAGIIAGFAAVTFIDARNFRGDLAADAALSARLAAGYCVAPLVFGYAEEAAQALEKLSLFDDINYVAVYDQEGRLFARYRREGSQGEPPALLADPGLASGFRAGIFEAREPVIYDGKRFGTISLAVSTGSLSRKIAGRAGLLALLAALMAAAALLVALRAQRVVSEPILSLADMERGVALRGDYSVRSGISRDDEIGALAAGFDALLESLGARSRERDAAEEALRQAHTEMEGKVRERTAELRLANKELEAFTYSASHDLRAPLRRIDGFSSLLEEDCAAQLSEEGREHLGRIRAGCRQMAQVIDSLLRLSRVMRQELDMKELDLSALAEEIFAGLRETEPLRKVQFTAAGGLTAVGDRVLLGEVLENLLSNAWKFTGKTAAPVIEFGASEKDGERIYFVRDNGKGFDMKYAGKLFRPFQRLHSPAEFPGTGIGLTTVQRIIERHGGRIWVEGEEDRGAVFYFTLHGRENGGSQAHKEQGYDGQTA
ncbi:MAG TPA: hypothetical protein DEQ38_07340 [Elusimicrobia bacterium]|nr:MAG: hypothetical protein A2089_08200 [Elusimicrobia bacterium GWD2_63_28]HCC47911.1 hypothetical protein [Elusimicrobiota bacterium]